MRGLFPTIYDPRNDTVLVAAPDAHTQVNIGVMSDDPNLLLTGLSAWDIKEKMCFLPNIFRLPHWLHVTCVSFNTSQAAVHPLTSIAYHSHRWMIKEVARSQRSFRDHWCVRVIE